MNEAHPIRRFREERGLSLEAFGALVGVRKAAVCKWESGRQVPAAQAKAIEDATGAAIPAWRLRPDLWAPPAEAAE